VGLVILGCVLKRREILPAAGHVGEAVPEHHVRAFAYLEDDVLLALAGGWAKLHRASLRPG
jgi:hypothetical protein